VSDVDGLRELREQLADALPTEVSWLFDGPHEYPTREERLRTADALIPVVTAWAERFAAEELRAAAEDAVSTGAGLCSPGVAPLMVVKVGELLARATALAEGGQP